MRRPAPRPLAAALAAAVGQAEPATLLARVQSAWPAAVGEVVAAEADPASERQGVVTVRCTSSLWASELELMAPDLAVLAERRAGLVRTPRRRSPGFAL